jgi:hypothetical protein
MAATDSASDQGEWRATLVDELNTTPPQTGAVIEAWPTEQAFIDAMADDVTLSDATGVVSPSASRLWYWFADE